MEPSEIDEKKSFFPTPTEGSGYGIVKLHIAIQDNTRALKAKDLQMIAEAELAGDDQRTPAFLATYRNKFACASTIALAPEKTFAITMLSIPKRWREDRYCRYTCCYHMSGQL